MPVDRVELERRIASVTAPGAHEPWHIAMFVDAVLADPVPGVLVECGAFRGVGTAKLSHLADMLGRQLWVFDSFIGLPPNDEPHVRTIHNQDVRGQFVGGAFAGSMFEVQQTVSIYGVPETVRYVAGWFADTLPSFAASQLSVAAVYLDVDLAASARTCLEQLWPLVSPGGVVVSQDGDFPLTVAAMRDWLNTADPAPCEVTGLGASKMVVFRKPVGRHDAAA